MFGGHFCLFYLLLYKCMTTSAGMTFHRTDFTYTPDIQVTVYEVTSKVTYRFAEVDVKCTFENMAKTDEDVEIGFSIPKEAIVTGLVYIIDGKEIKAIVKEKISIDAEKVNIHTVNYTTAYVLGQPMVKHHDHRLVFFIFLHISGGANVQVLVQYHELLRKRAGRYYQKIYVDPRQIKTRLQISTEINENHPVYNVDYKTPYNEGKGDIVVDYKSGVNGFHVVKLVWHPQIVPACSQNQYGEQGSNFELSYKLAHDESGGLILYNTMGDFVHYFNPTCENIIGKKIVFILDISGSMLGSRMEQISFAMLEVLNKLRRSDYFGIILHNANTTIWQKSLVEASLANVELAKEFMARIPPDIFSGGTDLELALSRAVAFFDEDVDAGQSLMYSKYIVLQVDSGPSDGLTNYNDLLAHARSVNYIDGKLCCKSSIVVGAVKGHVAIEFMTTLAVENAGHVATLESFGSNIVDDFIALYDQIENPVYRNIQFSYLSKAEAIPKENISEFSFFQVDCGDEIVIGGQATDSSKLNVKFDLIGNRKSGELTKMISVAQEHSSHVSRLVSYLRVQKLLEIPEIFYDKTRMEATHSLALNISLKHQLFTSVTSMVTNLSKPEEMQEKPTTPFMVIGGIVRPGNIRPDRPGNIRPDRPGNTRTDRPESNQTPASLSTAGNLAELLRSELALTLGLYVVVATVV